MQKVRIRIADTSDLKSLQKVSIDTFTEAFSASNTRENMRMYVEEAFSSSSLTRELEDSESLFFLAEYMTKSIGYLKVNVGKTQTESMDGNGLEVERIYVLKDYYGQNVGQQLLEKALEIALHRKVDYIWLGVWEKNPRAIRFYEKNGFVTFGSHIFRLGNDEQKDVLMKLVL
ncbi:MAG: GNAT family N-acetyltransferase [Chitinophagaceae bacterium]|nr:MAG: GNAT family N-acetyltransferase [Chitinophagaceae bacterium]